MENCSFVENTVHPFTEEQLEEINMAVPFLLELKAFRSSSPGSPSFCFSPPHPVFSRYLRIVNKMPLEMVMTILSKSLNIATIELDRADDWSDRTLLQLLKTNKLHELEVLSIAYTR